MQKIKGIVMCLLIWTCFSDLSAQTYPEYEPKKSVNDTSIIDIQNRFGIRVGQQGQTTSGLKTTADLNFNFKNRAVYAGVVFYYGGRLQDIVKNGLNPKAGFMLGYQKYNQKLVKQKIKPYFKIEAQIKHIIRAEGTIYYGTLIMFKKRSAVFFEGGFGGELVLIKEDKSLKPQYTVRLGFQFFVK